MSSETRRSADADVEALFVAATALVRARDIDAAEALLRRALAGDDAHVPSLHLLGLLAGHAGRDEECFVLLGRAVDLGDAPEAAAAARLLAAAYRRCGRSADAAVTIQRIAGWRDHPALAHELGHALLDQGHSKAAVDALTAALTAGEKPPLLNTLGVALKEQGRLDAAADAFERATALDGAAVESLYNLAAIRKDEGLTDSAVALLRRVVALVPDRAAARFSLCMAHLPPIYADEAELGRRRDDYAAELKALAVAAEERDPSWLEPGIGAAQPFSLAYQGQVDVDLQRRYGVIVCAAAAASTPLLTPRARRTGDRFRLGVVCGYFRDHSVWRLPTRGWVESIDRERFELFAYHTSGIADTETARAAQMFDAFVQRPFPVEEWRRRIAADGLDALIYPEIGMDPVVARLAATRLAPVQYASWGHPTTSGCPTIDYFLSSDAMEPSGADSHYTEQLIRLPGLSTPITARPLDIEPLSRGALGVPDQATVFWCGQSLPKYLPRHDDLFARIAARIPTSRFIFVAYPGSAVPTARFAERQAKAFGDRGLNAGEHCVFLPELPPAKFTAAMAAADVVLDSIGWSGCNSLVEAMRLGLPIVTCPGETMRARHGAALLGSVGLERLICRDEVSFVNLSAALANQSQLRASITAHLHSNLTRLADTSCVASLEQHLFQTIRHLPERLEKDT